MDFIRRVSGLFLRNRVRSLVIRERLGIEPLLLRIERSQMSHVDYVVHRPIGSVS